MKKKVSILHIDNNKADIEYVKQILKKQTYIKIDKYFSTSNFNEFKNLLSKGQIDIVLTDLNLAGFTGIDVLNYLKKYYPEISVIILTGTGTEELAVDALKKGADDYLTKKRVNFERLPEKIKFILQEKALKRKIEEKEKYLKTLTDILPEAIFDVKLPGRTISYATSGVYYVFGYSPEELIGEKTSMFFAREEEFKLLGEKIKKAVERKEKFVTFQTTLKKKNGEIFLAEITSTFLYKESGEIEKTIDIVRDITEEFARERELIFERNKFQSLFDNSIDAIFLLNEKGMFIDANNAAAELFECKKGDIIEKHPSFFSPEKQPDGELSETKAREKIENALKNIPQRFEWVIKTLKGKEIICSVSLNAFNLGKIKYITTIVRDITKMKKLEEDLRKQNQLMSHIFTLSPAIIYTLNPEDFSLQWYSKNLIRLLGYSKKEIKDGKNWWYRNVFKEDLKKEEIKLSSIFTDKHLVREYRFYKKDKSLIWIKDELVLIEDENGNPKEIIGVWLDITKSKEKEIESEERKKLLEAITENANEGIILLNQKGKIVFWNKAMEKIVGYTKEEILNKDPHSFLAPQQIQNSINNGNNLFTKGQLSQQKLNYTHTAKTKDGKQVVLDISLSDFEFSNNYFVLALVRDVTEKTSLEKAIREEKRKFELTLQSIEDAIIVVDKEERVMLLNPASEKLIGKPEEKAKGEKLNNLIELENEQGIKCSKILKEILKNKGIKKLKPDENVFTIKGKESSLFSISISPLSSNGTVEGAVIILRDISERIKLLETNARVSKLEAINTLAGGIAHDFNNMLTSLYGYLDLAHKVAIDPRVKNYLEKSIKTSDRAKALASRLLALSKKQEPHKKIQDISDNIIEVVTFTTSGSAIKTNFEIEPLPFVEVDITQIEEVIENIVINALQAMENKGELTVKANTVLLKEKEVGTLPEGKYVKISISDTGPGIPEEFRDRIFEPFFTTKEKGTGLGLAACYSIIKKHNGWIDFESEKGKGTTFQIYLPVARGKIKQPKIKEKRKKLKEKTGKGNIILMDDTDEVREVIKEFLYVLGYNVIETKKGEEVLNFFKEKVLTGEIEVKAIILDLIIKGGLGGKETCEKIREFDKNIPIIAISGFSDDPIIAKPEEFGFTTSLAKPIPIKNLEETLKKITKNQH